MDLEDDTPLSAHSRAMWLPQNDADYGEYGLSSSYIRQGNMSFIKTKSTVVVDKARPLSVTDLPPEILEEIFRFLPFETVGKIRLVCQRFNTIASSVLNSEFHRLRVIMLHRFQGIKAQMPRRESARRKHALARECDIVETLHMRLTLLHMTFAKHIERKNCCFFAGEILDEVYRILRYVKETPALSKAYKVTDELFDLSTMAMEYFKEHIEPSLPEITYFGGELSEYQSSLTGASPKQQLSLLDDPSSSSSCGKTPSVIENLPPIPGVNKRLRRLRETMKRNNGQVNAVKQELKATKRKVSTQQKHIHELKARFDDYDKKFQGTSHKLNAVLQELNHCKTELQYWRSKSPAVQCSCGKVTPILEVKEFDSTPAHAPFNVIVHQSDGDSKGGEDFKPILTDAHTATTTATATTTTTDSSYFVVFPDCRSTPPPDSTPVSSLAPPKQSKVKSYAKIDDNSNTKKPTDVRSKGCKRKLDLEQDDNLFIKVATVKKTLAPRKKKM